MFSGCVASSEDEEAPPNSEMPTCGSPCVEPVAEQVDQPDLIVGTTWHYRSELYYDIAKTLNITVAKKTSGGYLFASPSKDDLVGEVTWDRPWYGLQAANLTPIDYRGSRWISFPLFDGKTWEFDASRGHPDAGGRAARIATARLGAIKTPSGTEEGYAIDVDADQFRFHAEYAPSIGFFTRVESMWRGESHDRLELTGMSRSTEAVWFERGTATYVSDPAAPKTFDLASGYGSVVVSAGSAEGGRDVVVPPPGDGRVPWVYEGRGKEAWGSVILPATPGTWALVVADSDDCDGCEILQVVPVKWLET